MSAPSVYAVPFVVLLPAGRMKHTEVVADISVLAQEGTMLGDLRRTLPVLTTVHCRVIVVSAGHTRNAYAKHLGVFL